MDSTNNNILFSLGYNPIEPNLINVPGKETFLRKFNLKALRLEKKWKVSKFLSLGKNDEILLNLPKIKTIIPDISGNNETILLILNLNLDLLKLDNQELYKKLVYSTELFKYIDEHIPEKEKLLTDFKLELQWENWSVEQILESMLPKGSEIPSSYETIGHIAHLNLKKELLPYKFIIGKVILLKNPLLRTVVNKLDSIDTVFRTFDMEVLAGDDDLNASLKESGCIFKFNFKEVYWNSRLQTEHLRLVDTYFNTDHILCDGCAGIGPFAIPAGKNKGLLVLANDLNPNSFKYMKSNIKVNHVENNVIPYNMDANKFITSTSTSIGTLTEKGGKWEEVQKIFQKRILDTKNIVKRKRKLTDIVKEEENFDIIYPSKFRVHYVFNLPGHARNFLAQFRTVRFADNMEVYVHLYTFHRPTFEPVPELIQNIWECLFIRPDIESEDNVNKALIPKCKWELSKTYFNATPSTKESNNDISQDECRVWRVRNVAPGKEMVCISFLLPKDLI